MPQLTHASLLILAGTLLAAPAHAQDCSSPTGRHVRVAGSAVVRLPPDRVSFSVGVETLQANVSQAFRMNAQKVEAVLAALKTKGVQPKELQASDLLGVELRTARDGRRRQRRVRHGGDHLRDRRRLRAQLGQPRPSVNHPPGPGGSAISHST